MSKLNSTSTVHHDKNKDSISSSKFDLKSGKIEKGAFFFYFTDK